MKKIFLILTAFVSVFLLYNCKNGDEDNGNPADYEFSIDRDTGILSGAIGNFTDVKFNIVANYDFASVPMKFKFSLGSMKGTLKLNGQTLKENTEYFFENKENMFQFLGSQKGQYQLKFTVSNSKGISKTEEIYLNFDTFDFSVTPTPPAETQYQGVENIYALKILPSLGTPADKFKIKFNSYDGNMGISLDGNPAELNTLYEIADFNNFKIGLKTKNAGSVVLKYSVVYQQVEKDFEIEQNVSNNRIEITEMTPDKTTVIKGEAVTFTGTIAKNPLVSNAFQFKSWLEGATTNGITNTNGNYTDATLDDNGNFSYQTTGLQVGIYNFKYQARDEFGNESGVKTFNLTVKNTLQINSASASLQYQMRPDYYNGSPVDVYYFSNPLKISLNAQSNNSSNLTKAYMVLIIGQPYNSSSIRQEYTVNLPAGTKQLNWVNNSLAGSLSNYNVPSGTTFPVTVNITLYNEKNETAYQQVNVNMIKY